VGIEELDRMSKIVEDLLLLARLEEGMTLVREPVEVELVLQEAMLRGLLIAPREIEVDARPGLFVLADADRLLQVVSNLVTNALHHAGPKATIGITSRSQQGRVLIEVSDTGAGIPPEDIPHIFERLYRGSAPKTDAPSGAGLGLAIAASLTEAMGGEIRATSTPGVGTTFSISLSAAPDQTGEPQASRRAGVTEPS
jgi:signal transduction histidine kinase